MNRIQSMTDKDCRGRILVTGPCDAEVSGLVTMLYQTGYPAFPSTYTQPHSADLVVVALSAVPAVGWGRWLTLLHILRLQGSYRIVTVVPACYLRVVSVLQGCPAVNGQASLPELYRQLRLEILQWRRNAPVSQKKCPPLSGDDIRMLSSCLRAKDCGYNTRYYLMSRMGFSRMRDLMLFVANGWPVPESEF